MGKGCIELMKGVENEGNGPPNEVGAQEVAGGEKSKVRNARTKKDARMRKDSSVECSGCGRWVSARDADVDGVLESEVDKMEVFCLRCVYGVLSELRAELRASRDEVCALREAHVSSSSEVRVLLAEGCKCKCTCRTGVNDSNENDNISEPVPEVSNVLEPVVEQGSGASTQRDGSSVGVQKRVRNPLSPARSDGHDDGFRVVERKRRRIKPTINIVGDSMVRNVTKLIKCEEEGSGCVSLRGAGVKQIMESVSQNACDMKRNGLLIVQGGGNSLNALGPNETVECIMNTVRETQNKRKDIRIAVVGIMPRPKESKRYETMRNRVNKMIQEQVCALKLTLLKKREGDVSYLDIDSVLTKEMYAKDGVHLNAEGDIQFGRRLLQWVKEKERCHESIQ